MVQQLELRKKLVLIGVLGLLVCSFIAFHILNRRIFPLWQCALYTTFALVLIILNVQEYRNTLGAQARKAIQKAGELQAKGEWSASKEQFQKALKSESRNLDALSGLGAACYQMRQYAEAEAWFEKAIKANPNMAQAHYLLGLCYVQDKKADQAIAAFKQSIAIRGDFPDVHMHLGDVYRIRGDLVHAARSYRTFLSLAKDEAQKQRVQEVLKQVEPSEAERAT